MNQPVETNGPPLDLELPESDPALAFEEEVTDRIRLTEQEVGDRFGDIVSELTGQEVDTGTEPLERTLNLFELPDEPEPPTKRAPKAEVTPLTFEAPTDHPQDEGLESFSRHSALPQPVFRSATLESTAAEQAPQAAFDTPVEQEAPAEPEAIDLNFETVRPTQEPRVVMTIDGERQLISRREAIEIAITTFQERNPKYTASLASDPEAMALLSEGKRPDSLRFRKKGDGEGFNPVDRESGIGEAGMIIRNAAQKNATQQERDYAREALAALTQEGESLAFAAMLHGVYDSEKGEGQTEAELRQSMTNIMTGATALTAASANTAELEVNMISRAEAEIANWPERKKKAALGAIGLAVGAPTTLAASEVTGATDLIDVDGAAEALGAAFPSAEAVIKVGAWVVGAGVIGGTAKHVAGKIKGIKTNILKGIDEWHVNREVNDYAKATAEKLDEIDADEDRKAKLSDEARAVMLQEVRNAADTERFKKEFMQTASSTGTVYRVIPGRDDEGQPNNELELVVDGDVIRDKIHELAEQAERMITEKFGLQPEKDEKPELDDKALGVLKGWGKAVIDTVRKEGKKKANAGLPGAVSENL